VSYWRLFCRISPEIIIIRWHNPLFSWLAGVYARLVGCSVIIYEQISSDLLNEVWSSGWKGCLLWIHFRTRQRLLNAAWMTPLPAEARLPEGCYFVPFAVPIHARPQSARGVPRILEVGKFVSRKNHLGFVSAIREIGQDMPVPATIVGEASNPSQRQLMDKVAKAVAEAGLTNVVSIRSNVAHDEMPGVYDEHSLFVLPAIAEPAAISPLEAMGHGLPVVVADTCGTKGYVGEGRNGFVCASGSTTALADAIRKAVHLSQRPGVRDRMAADAAAHFSGMAFLASFTSMVEQHFGIPFVSSVADPGGVEIRN
jgi:glycosyltransferase involved in cell wall biosynthesis